MFGTRMKQTFGVLVAIFTLTAMAGGAAALGAFDVDSSTSSTEDVTLAEGSTTDYTFATDDTNSKDIRWKDSNGNLIYEKTGISTTTDDDGNDIVETSLQDEELINDADFPVEDGDEVTVEVYDSTDSEVDYTVTQTVDFTADSSFDVTDSAVSDNEDISVESEDGIAFLVDSYKVAEVNHEFVFSDADMDQDQREGVVQISDSEVLTQFENAQTDRGIIRSESVADGEELEMDAVVEGEEVDVYLNQAPEDHDGPHTLVYDANQEQLELTTTSDEQGLTVSVDANKYSMFEFPDFGVQEKLGF